MHSWGELTTTNRIIIMAKPFPYAEPWASFDKQSYSMVTQEFAHEKVFAITLRHDSARGNSIYAKGEATSIKNQYKSSGEINALVPLWSSRNGYAFFRTRSDYVKLRYEEALKDLMGPNSVFIQCNLYGSYQANKNFNNVAMKAGAILFAKSFSLETRVKVKLEEAGFRNIETGHKFAWGNEQVSINSYKVFNWKHCSLINNAIRIGYRKNDYEIYLRAQNQTSRNLGHLHLKNMDTYFTKFIFDYVKKIDDLTKIALETQLGKNSIQKSSLVVQRSTPDRQVGFKARISTDKSAAICYQTVMGDYGKWTAGFEVSDIGRTNKCRYGLRFDLNL